MRFGAGWARACVEDETLELEEGDEVPDTVLVPLQVAAGKLTRQIILRAPRDWTQDAFRLKLGQPRQVFAAHVLEPTRLEDGRSPIDLPPALRDIAGRISELASELDPCGPYAIEQVRHVVVGYGELLDNAAAGNAAEKSRRVEQLRGRLRLLPKGDPERSQLLEEIEELSEPAQPERAGGLSTSTPGCVAAGGCVPTCCW